MIAVDTHWYIRLFARFSRVGGFACASIFLSLSLAVLIDWSLGIQFIYFECLFSATRIGSGRFNQQRAQEQGQRRREGTSSSVTWTFRVILLLERMRRSGGQNSGHPGGISEFHLDVPSIPAWPSSSMPPPPPPPSHIQLLPTTINGHHIGTDHLMNGGSEQMDRKSIGDPFLSLRYFSRRRLCLESTYFPSFLYPSAVQPSSFNANGTVYFTHAPPLMPGTAPNTQGPPNSLPSQTHFPPFHPGRTFENSNRHSFHQPAHFQPSSSFQMPHPLQVPSEDTPMDLPPRFRRGKPQEYENHFSQPRPMSGDFDRFRNGQYPSSNYTSRPNNDHRAQTRPQSFYDFSSPSPANNNNNNNFLRSSNNARFQRNNSNNNTSLPLSAYMNAEESSSYPNDNGNRHQQWGTSYARRRPVNQPRTYQQDKHQFPLSSYDPRQYGFATPNGKRTDPSQRAHPHGKGPSDIDLIEEWWEDNNNNNNSEVMGTEQVTATVESQPATAVNDSGNSSLSTSINLKESTLDDEENNLSTNDFISPPSDVSTSDSEWSFCHTDRLIFSSLRFEGVIIESLDKLQQELKLEEALDLHLAAADDQSSEKDLSLLLNNEVSVCLVSFTVDCRRTLSVPSLRRRPTIPRIFCNGLRTSFERN